MFGIAPWRSFAVIPAAGESRRMGQAKLLLPWRGKRIIDHVLDAWRASQVDFVVVVVRIDDIALIDAVRRGGADAALVDPPPKEMKGSVALGLEFVGDIYSPSIDDVWLLAPADMPRVSSAVINRLLDEHDPNYPQILVPRAGDKTGHPVLFPWELAAEVRTLAADEGINGLRKRFPSREVAIEDRAGFDDLDTPDDYRKLGE